MKKYLKNKMSILYNQMPKLMTAQQILINRLAELGFCEEIDYMILDDDIDNMWI